MTTMNISLPSSLKSFVDDKDRLQLRSLLLAGAASEPAGEADAAYFAGLRQRVQQAAAPGQRD